MDARLEHLRKLCDAAKPLPEQSSRMAEAMAGRDDDRRRREFESAALAFVRELLDQPETPDNKDRDVLWQDPENEKNWLGFRNGIITACHDGVQSLESADTLWIKMSSRPVPRTEYDVPAPPFGDESKKEFHYGDVAEAIEKIVGVPQASCSVRYGFDGFYHLVYRRRFGYGDRQEKMAQDIITLLLEYDVTPSSRVVIDTGEVQAIIYLDKEKVHKRLKG